MLKIVILIEVMMKLGLQVLVNAKKLMVEVLQNQERKQDLGFGITSRGCKKTMTKLSVTIVGRR